MKSLDKIFKEQVAKAPLLAVAKVIRKKLEAAGVEFKEGMAEAAARHILSGNSDTFQWDDGTLEDKKVNITLTEEDTEECMAALQRFRTEELPVLVEKTSREAAETIVNTLLGDWPEQKSYEAADLVGFRQRLEHIWGGAFDLLRILLTVCREVGGEHVAWAGKSRSRKNRHLRDVVARLHARACQVGAEIIVLMENGFADGAMARWRTLHEIAVVAAVITDGGDTVAALYAAHEIIDSKKAMEEFDRSHQALGFKPMAKREKKKIEKTYAEAIATHGADFDKPYGWACVHFKKKRITFADLEIMAQKSDMKSFYKLASYNVHADTKGIAYRMGTMGDRSVLLAGASNAGFVDPGQHTASSLVHITVLLVAERIGTFDMLVKMQVLQLIRDMAPKAFAKAERQLKRDHAKFNR